MLRFELRWKKCKWDVWGTYETDFVYGSYHNSQLVFQHLCLTQDGAVKVFHFAIAEVLDNNKSTGEKKFCQ